MNTLLFLESKIDELVHLGEDSSSIYKESFRNLNTTVFQLCESLLSIKGKTTEEEARLCFLLLKGYGAITCSEREYEKKIHTLLNRTEKVIEQLHPTAHLKEQLVEEIERLFVGSEV